MFKNSIFRKMLACTTAVLGFQSLSAATYYVNDNATVGDYFTYGVGVDAPGRGSSSLPFATMSYMINQHILTAGDIVYIDSGTYNWTEIAIPSGLNNLTITGAGLYSTKIITQGGGHSISLTSVTGLKLSGVYMENSANTVMMVRPGSGGCTISNSFLFCKSGAIGLYAIEFNNTSSGSDVRNCTLKSQYGTLRFYNSVFNVLTSNTMTSQNTTQGMIRMENNAVEQTFITNTITGAPGSSIFYEDGTSNYHLLNANTINGGGSDAGFLIYGDASALVITNNVFTNMKDGIVNNSNTYLAAGPQLKNNSFYVSRNALKGYFFKWTIESNIFYTTSNNSTDYCVNSINLPTALDNNLYYTSGYARAASINGIAYTSVSDIKYSTSYEYSGLQGNPLYVSAPSNLHLLAGSPAIGTGIYGTTYLGAYPYSSSGYRLGSIEQASTSVGTDAAQFIVHENNLILTNGNEDAIVEIFSIGGMKMKSSLGTSKISLDELSAGMYILHINSNGVTTASKIVKL